MKLREQLLDLVPQEHRYQAEMLLDDLLLGSYEDGRDAGYESGYYYGELGFDGGCGCC